MENNVNRELEVPIIRTLAIIKKIDDLPDWRIAKIGENTKPSKKRRHHKNVYKNWNMPEQPEGYIKAKKNDLL